MRAYWFGGDTLPHGDGRPVAVGVTHTVEPPIVPCWRGLHASVHPSDALKYAQCASLWLVELAGEIEQHGSPPDKLAASERTYLARIDATDLLREYARWCASQVLHMWDAPNVVREYLATGDESIRDAARAAAMHVASPAARAARIAAWDCSQDAARDVAWDSVWDADEEAVWSTQRAHLLGLVEAAFRAEGVTP